jgi:hypothetical protein
MGRFVEEKMYIEMELACVCTTVPFAFLHNSPSPPITDLTRGNPSKTEVVLMGDCLHKKLAPGLSFDTDLPTMISRIFHHEALKFSYRLERLETVRSMPWKQDRFGALLLYTR